MAQSARNKAAILSSLPPSIVRIQVQEVGGRVKYKRISDVLDTDTILFKSDGTPIVMSGAPGRRPKAEPLPPTTEEAGKAMEQKQGALAKDSLLNIVRTRPEAGEVLDQVMVGLAEEVASLQFERHEAERKGLDTSKISVRRINGLKATADTWLKRKDQISAAGVDLESKAFEKVFEFILGTFRKCMEDAEMRPEMVETVFGFLAKRLEDGWKEDAKAVLKEIQG